MSKFTIVSLIDKIFITVSTFLIVYAWINLYLLDLKVTFILSLIFTFAIMFILFYFLERKTQKNNLSKHRINEIEKSFFAFRILPQQTQLEFINTLLLTNFQTKIKDSCIIFNKDNKKQVIVIKSNSCINQTAIFEILNNLNEEFDTLNIICEQAEQNLKTHFLKDKEIEIINKATLYEQYFEKYNIFPNLENLCFENLKPTLKTILINFISPNKSKRYFYCGLLFIFSSLIIPMKIYYFTFGTIFLLLSITCRIRKYFYHKFSSKQTPNI